MRFDRDPASVPVTIVRAPADLAVLAAALGGADRVAIDTEVPIAGRGAGRLRVMSVATRDRGGHEQAFVVDARDLDPTTLAPLLVGVEAAAWNASFDARVLDEAVWDSRDVTRTMTWWDAQLGDALLHQGRSGFTWYHGLAWAVEHYLGFEVTGKGSVQLSYTATDDLSREQVAYAAADAVETLWVADEIRVRVERAGLAEVAGLEMSARPFLDQMQRSGLPFDWDGWRGELDRIEVEHREALGRLAGLTGGGQGTLFDDIVEPTWNPASDKQVRAALNRWSEAEVLAFTARHHGDSRPLREGDSVTAGVLREIGGELADALLEFRHNAKILSTYGESIREHVDDDGRVRPQYLQVVGTNTGRLASRNPNAQNFSPRMKPYFRPAANRVFVHADLSQAELRFLAQVAEDHALRAAFARGDDVHVRTAASMFGFEPDALAASDPARFAELRQIAKALNFGIAYGTGAASLGRSLTSNGAPTTTAQAQELLGQYRRTYPGTAAWAQERIAEIESISLRTAGIDWATSRRLATEFPVIAEVRRDLRRRLMRWPSAAEIADELDRSEVGDRDSRPPVDLAVIEWVLGYSAPVALEPNGGPFTFASRTVAGRRQQFNLHLDRLYLTAAIGICGSRAPSTVRARQEFGTQHRLDLAWADHEAPVERLNQLFEDRAVRRRFIDAMVDSLGSTVVDEALGRAARDRTRAMVNAWRNAPIQGGVADIMLDAYGRLHTALERFDSAEPVQTVHDSVVIECDRTEAGGVVAAVTEALESASRRFCPDVVPRADVDVRTSLAEYDVTSWVEPAVPGAAGPAAR